MKMDFSARNCYVSLDNGMSWSTGVQMWSGAATGSATLKKVAFTHPETSTSPSYGATVWYVDGVDMWTGAVALEGKSLGSIEIRMGYSLNVSPDVSFITIDLYEIAGTVGATYFGEM